ncbi:MAG TPA: hypothetical protein VGH52_05645 [Gaiellaceae bacterium]
MKFLVVVWRSKYLQNYEPVLRLLAQRGHRIHVTFSEGPTRAGSKGFSAHDVERLAHDFPGVITWDDTAPGRDPADGWLGIANRVRAYGDLVRYSHPRYRNAPLLRGRALRRSRGSQLLFGWSNARLADWLRGVARDAERAIPSSGRIEDYLRHHAPDLVLVTPLLDLGSAQPEFLKSAAKLAIPNAVGVASWDNLTNKGTIRNDPDAVFVWNEAQRREADELHDVPLERVLATGAPKFDEWFARRPTLDFAAFAAKVGLDPAQPYVLYVCSSYFVASEEPAFVERWLEALGEREFGVLVRPHPENAKRWRTADLSRFPNVVVYPRDGAAVVDEASRADYFHSLLYSKAVVGINTSALIEAAIVGKGVYTVLDPQFGGTQEGTLHFHHLLRENGGVLHVARSLEEHAAQLAAAGDEDTRAFVESFVRPAGLDVEAAPLFVDELERLAMQPARLPVATARSRLIHGALAPVAVRRRSRAPLPPRTAAKQAELLLASVRRHSRIVVGPWLRDSVEEVLYWLPYLGHLREELGLERSQLVAVSYGGVASWYEDLCGDYVDLNELLGEDTVEGLLVSRVPERERAEALVLEKLGSHAAISPSVMRRVFAPYRRGDAAIGFVAEFTKLGRIGPQGERCGAVDEAALLGDRRADRAELVRAAAGAERLVGSAAGLGLIGPSLGVETVLVGEESSEADLDLCAWTALQLGVPLSFVDRSELPLLRELAGTIRR